MSSFPCTLITLLCLSMVNFVVQKSNKDDPKVLVLIVFFEVIKPNSVAEYL
jgi:hypothetical protein